MLPVVLHKNVHDRFVFGGPACLFVGAVPMATACWDPCQCGLVFLVSHRWLTVLQLSIQSLSPYSLSLRQGKSKSGGKNAEKKSETLAPCDHWNLHPLSKTNTSPIVTQLDRERNSSGITAVSYSCAPDTPRSLQFVVYMGVVCRPRSSSLPPTSSCSR